MGKRGTVSRTKVRVDEFVDYSTDLGLYEPEYLIQEAQKAGIFAWDLETTGLSPLKDSIEGIAIYIPACRGRDEAIRAWFPFVEGTFLCYSKKGEVRDLRPAMPQRETMERLRPIFVLPGVVKVTANGKFDLGFTTFASGCDEPISVKSWHADSMLCDFLGDERRRRYGLKYRTKDVFGVEMTTYNEAVRGQSMLAFCNQKPLGVYAMDDTMWTYRLHEHAMSELRKQTPARRRRGPLTGVEKEYGWHMGKLERIYWGIDVPVSEIIMEMETTGCLIDWRHLQNVEERLLEKKQKLKHRIEEFLGWPLNPNAPPQVADALFAPPPDGLGLPKAGIPLGKNGLPSTGDKVIKHFKRFHPLVEDILEHRSVDTVLTGFVTKLIKLATESPTGRVHSGFNQTRTVIARLSCVHGDTVLDTSNGSVKISELDLSDGRNYTIETHLGRQRRILRRFYKGREEMVDVQTEAGTIRCTRKHVVLTDQGWREVGALQIGDRIARPGGMALAGAARALEGHEEAAERAELRQDLHRGAADPGRADGPLRDLLRGSDPVPQALRPALCVATQNAPVPEPLASHARQPAWAGEQGDQASPQDQDAPPSRQAGGPGSAGAQGRGDRPASQDHRVPRPTQHQALRDPARLPASSQAPAPLDRGGRAAGGPRARIHRGGAAVLRGARGVLQHDLPGHDRTGDVGGRATVVRPQPRLLRACRADPQESRLLVAEPGRDAALAGASRRGGSPSAGVLLLQELEGGLLLPTGPTAGGSGRRVSPQGQDDQGSRPAQDGEGEGAWLSVAQVHDRRSDPGDGAGRLRDRGGYATIQVIAPAGIHDVWDIEVEEDHSYVAHGLIHHNSSNPINFQNQPRDKNLVRRAYVAYREGIDPPDMCLMGGDYAQIELRLAAHLAIEHNMIEVYKMLGICKADGGKACERYKLWVCEDGKCEHTWTPENWDSTDKGLECPKCKGTHTEHQKRCRHVDLHQRTADDAQVKRNPLAKCLDGSTLVARFDKGVHHERPAAIESILGGLEAGEHYPIAPFRLETGATGDETSPPIPVRATSGLKRHNRPTKIVVTRRAIVVATEDHRFQVIGDYDSLDPDTPGYVHVPGYSLVEAQNLEKGMKLPLAEFGKFDRDNPAWHADRSPQSFRLNPFTKEPDPDGPASILLDEKWAYFAGVFAGDGCASGNSCTITHGSDDSYAGWRNTIREACDDVGLPNRVSRNKKHTVIGSRVVRRYFAGMELAEEAGTTGAKIMRVPSWVLAGGPKIAWSYLAGLFDTDGTVDCVVSVTTKYPEFAGQVAFLLRWLGMPVSISPSWNKTYKRYYYTLSVLGEGLKRFLRYCPMRYTEKVEKLRARCAEIKREVAPKYDEVLLVLDGGERTVYDFQVESDDHLYLQGGLIGHNNLNFGLLYRMGAPKFCVYADLFDADGNPMVEYARQVIERWHAAYPAISVYHDYVEEMLPKNNWIMETLTGRRRRLYVESKINRYRAITQGIQFSVSGSAQDLIKIAMTRTAKERAQKIANSRPAERKEWERWKFLLQVHDECQFQVPLSIKDEACEIFKRCMETADGGRLRVPLVCDVKTGYSWDDTH